MVGCVFPFLVYVPEKKTASNHRVMFRGKWTQMIERLFYEQSESQRRVLGGYLSNSGHS